MGGRLEKRGEHARDLTLSAATRGAGFDQMILLGDMFTYGMNPVECAELAADAMDKDGALLIGGNHAQLELELEPGTTD